MKNSLYLFSPILFFLLFFRASLDPLLDLTKFGGIGLGAGLNLLVLIMLFSVLLKFKFELPLSLIKLWGGFILLGLANAVWILILARLVDGLLGSNMTVSQAYISDVTEPKNRTKIYGYSSAVFGAGLIFDLLLAESFRP